MEAPTVAEPLAERKLRGREFLRQLASATTRTYRERPLTAQAAQVLRAAAYGGGLSISELERSSGLGRQAIYNLLQSERQAPSSDPRFEALAVIASQGSSTPQGLAPVLGLDLSETSRILEVMERDGLLSESSVAVGLETTRSYMLDAGGDRALQEAVERAELRTSHPDAWFIFISVADVDVPDLLAAAERVCGSGAELLEARVSSAMAGPELGLLVDAPDQRDAFAITHRIYAEILTAAGQPPSPAPIAAFSPPPGLSE